MTRSHGALALALAVWANGCSAGSKQNASGAGFGTGPTGATGVPGSTAQGGAAPAGTSPGGTGAGPGGGSVSSLGSGGGTTAGGAAAAAGGPSGSTQGGGGAQAPGGGGAAAGTGDAPTAGAPSTACGANLLAAPDDPGVRGPWDVGVRTVTAGRVTAELMYPAKPGSTAGVPEATYNPRDWLPPSEQSKVPNANAPLVGPLGGHFYRDVPVDDQHGPYPLIIFIHGTASLRIGSASLNAQWASRGFVVIAADYPGLGLADQLAPGCGLGQSGLQDVSGDADAQLQGLTSGSGDFAFIKDHVDVTRVAIVGHSQGGCMAAQMSRVAGVQMIMPLDSSTSTSVGPLLESIMYVSGMDDTVIGYSTALIGNSVCPANPLPATSDTDAYSQSPGPPDVKVKRLVGIKGGGHLVPTDLCETNAAGRNAVQEAEADGVCGVDTAGILGLPTLADCGVAGFDWKAGVHAVGYATTAALEETLLCKDRSAVFASLSTQPLIGDFQHTP
ncbi:MAG: alpha/beta hydrolase family protein [Polyangiales bacterium]